MLAVTQRNHGVCSGDLGGTWNRGEPEQGSTRHPGPHSTLAGTLTRAATTTPQRVLSCHDATSPVQDRW